MKRHRSQFLNNVIILCICFACLLTLKGVETEECQYVQSEFDMLLGTKTPYRVNANYDDRYIWYPGCKPVQIIGIIRHGTRTFDNKFQNKVNQLEELRDSIFDSANVYASKVKLCKDENSRLKKWEPTPINGEKVLTHEGEDEMVDLAERLQNRFPSLLPEEYKNETYLFRYTDTQRTAESARYFTIGLFGRRTSQHVFFPEPIYKDPLLRFYKLCERWRKEVKKNSSSRVELSKYMVQPEVLKARQRISKALGLNYTLSYDVVHTMYIVCSFETAWMKSKQSPWCPVFSGQDMKVLEYAEDLKYYWVDGYGFDINYKQACPVVKHVISNFNNRTVKTPAIFYFTHSGTLLKLISHLGLYKDDFKLNHDTPPTLKNTRKWMVSKIDSFGTNLIFVHFDCKGEGKILTMHQEKVVKIPGCPIIDDLCPLSSFNNTFEEMCNFDQMCSL